MSIRLVNSFSKFFDLKNSRFIKKSGNIYEIKKKVITSQDIDEVPPDCVELHVICKVFHFKSDILTTFRGNNLAIITKNVEIHKSCTVDLSGIPKAFFSDARQDASGVGRDGEDGCAGESGGHFFLMCKSFKFQNGSTLKIISNGADGTNGQNGGNGQDGANGKDATERSFRIENFDWEMGPSHFDRWSLCHKFKLDTIQNNTAQSKITTEDGLTAYCFLQTQPDEDWGLILIKGEDLAYPGKLGGCGGYGGEGGCPGLILIQCDQNIDLGRIERIANFGKEGKNGIGGLNGVKGRPGRDLCKYGMRSLPESLCFGDDRPAKFKLSWGKNDYFSVWDGLKDDFVGVEKICDIPEISPEKTRNEGVPKKEKPVKCFAKSKNSINVDSIRKEFFEFLNDGNPNFVKENVRKLTTKLLSNFVMAAEMTPMEYKNICY